MSDDSPIREIETIDPLRDDRWRRVVEASPNARIFHHRAWLNLLHAQYNYPMLSRCVVDEDGEIVAALPFAYVKSRLTGTRVVAVPFSDICAPVTRDAGGRADSILFDAISAQHQRDRIDVEIRAPVEGVGRPATSFFHHELALSTDVDAVRRGFRSSVRGSVAKAGREGVEVVLARDRRALDDFYRLHLITRRRLGVPTQPKSFIRRFAGLFEDGLGFVLLARAGGRTIAAAVFLTFNGVVTYKYGASDPRFLKKQPNNALLMEAIRWGCAHGYRAFDLGRTDIANAGLRSFKRGWGAEERVLTYTRLSQGSANSDGGGVPAFAESLIRRLPPIGSRVIGQLAYKHFG